MLFRLSKALPKQTGASKRWVKTGEAVMVFDDGILFGTAAVWLAGVSVVCRTAVTAFRPGVSGSGTPSHVAPDTSRDGRPGSVYHPLPVGLRMLKRYQY
jgi:hypothetical protein